VPRVVADHREEQSEIPEILRGMGVSVEFRLLEVADYVVAERMAVERKSAHDFVSSIYDGRLFRQAMELAQHYEVPIILVEGDPSDIEMLFRNERVYYGALASLIMDLNVRTVFTSGAEQTATFLERAAVRAEEKGERGPRVVKRTKIGIAQAQLYLVASAPGIGPKLADRLLRRMGSPAAVFSAPEGALAKVLGEKRARRLRELLDRNYEGAPRDDGSQVHLA
jgi:DNA excision repair protein ERCC-4